PSATSGTALNRPLDDEPVPASAVHAFCNWSPSARWPRLFDGVPPGSLHAAFACGGGIWIGFLAALGSMATILGSVMTAIHSPGSLSFSFLNGFLIPASAPLQAETLNAMAAIRPQERIPRLPPRPTFEPPLFRGAISPSYSATAGSPRSTRASCRR